MPTRKSIKMSEIMAILNEPTSDDEEDQVILNSKEVDVIYIPPPVVEDVTDEEDLDDDLIQLNDNNDDCLHEIAGTVELQYSVETENIKDAENEPIGTENPSTSSACGGLKRKSDFALPIWRKPRDFEYTRTPINVEALKMEEIFSEISKYLIHFL